MTRDEILKAFAGLSAEDQEAVREGIAGKTAGGKEETGNMANKCREMMAKCCCC